MTRIKLKITRQEVLTFTKEMEPFLIMLMAFLIYLRKDDIEITQCLSTARSFFNGLLNRLESKSTQPEEDKPKLVPSPGYED